MYRSIVEHEYESLQCEPNGVRTGALAKFFLPDFYQIFTREK